jgi:microcystin-dependent protein
VLLNAAYASPYATCVSSSTTWDCVAPIAGDTARQGCDIGTTYGTGNGSTTFTLPDLRGYFVRGAGTNSDGVAAGTFGAKQTDDFKSHTHTDNGGYIANEYDYSPGEAHPALRRSLNIVTGATGGTETRPRNIAMLYCIKF